jgi:F-type H+-transporting ATPase subunit delta
MSRLAVARTYADALLELADRTDAAGEWLAHLDEVVGMYREEPDFRAFLETPRIGLADKRRVLRTAFGDRYPELFLRFFLTVLEKHRQSLLPDIEEAARDLQNERTGRVHAAVTMTIDPDPELREEIEAALARALDRKVAADFRSDPRLVGGLIVRVKDRVLDGSLRRRLQLLRRTLIEEAESAGATG